MRITFDPAKRVRTLAERGLDFEDAELVTGTTIENDREKAHLAPYLEIGSVQS